MHDNDIESILAQLGKPKEQPEVPMANLMAPDKPSKTNSLKDEPDKDLEASIDCPADASKIGGFKSHSRDNKKINKFHAMINKSENDEDG